MLHFEKWKFVFRKVILLFRKVIDKKKKIYDMKYQIKSERMNYHQDQTESFLNNKSIYKYIGTAVE